MGVIGSTEAKYESFEVLLSTTIAHFHHVIALQLPNISNQNKPCLSTHIITYVHRKSKVLYHLTKKNVG